MTTECIVIVGGTCAGKTTLVDAVRDAKLAGVDVPTRYVTRPLRSGDNTIENVHVSEEEFERKVAAGEIGVHWRRAMERGRIVRYGFRPAHGFAIYSANNAILTALPARALIVSIAAPEDVRADRLRRRSPDLSADEIRYRLAERTAHSHVVIENHGAHEATARQQLIDLVRATLGARGAGSAA